MTEYHFAGTDATNKDHSLAAELSAAAVIAAGVWVSKGKFVAVAEASAAVADSLITKGASAITAGAQAGELATQEGGGSLGRLNSYLDSTSQTAIRLGQGQDPALVLKAAAEEPLPRFAAPSVFESDYPAYRLAGSTSQAAPDLPKIAQVPARPGIPLSWPKTVGQAEQTLSRLQSWLGDVTPAQWEARISAQANSHGSYLLQHLVAELAKRTNKSL